MPWTLPRYPYSARRLKLSCEESLFRWGPTWKRYDQAQYCQQCKSFETLKPNINVPRLWSLQRSQRAQSQLNYYMRPQLVSMRTDLPFISTDSKINAVDLWLAPSTQTRFPHLYPIFGPHLRKWSVSPLRYHKHSEISDEHCTIYRLASLSVLPLAWRLIDSLILRKQSSLHWMAIL